MDVDDVLELAGIKEPDDEVIEVEDIPADVHVCDVVVNGKVCGETYDTKQRLSAHKLGKHRLKADGSAAAVGGRPKTTASKPKAAKAETKKAAEAASAPDTDKAGMYATSITTAALLIHLGAGRYFDSYDLGIVTRGAPNLGAALDQVGDKNESVRRACDAILGGGTGGAYVQLFLAAVTIAVPIAAHHNLLPVEVGGRFAEMIGAVAPTAATTAPPAPPSASPAAASGGEEQGVPPTSHTPDVHDWTMDDWMHVILQIPPHILADLTGRMMGGSPEQMATVVNIPTGPAFTIEEEHDRGAAGSNGAASVTVPES